MEIEEAGLRPAGTNGAFAKLTSESAFKMSGDVASKFQIYRFLDPRFNPNNPDNIQDKYIAVSGGPAMTRYVCTAAEYSDKHIRWNNIVPLGPEFLYDMHMLVHYKIHLKITGLKNYNVMKKGDGTGYGSISGIGWSPLEYHIPTGSNVHPFQGNTFSLRAYPLHQCTRSIVLRLNDRDPGSPHGVHQPSYGVLASWYGEAEFMVLPSHESQCTRPYKC